MNINTDNPHEVISEEQRAKIVTESIRAIFGTNVSLDADLEELTDEQLLTMKNRIVGEISRRKSISSKPRRKRRQRMRSRRIPRLER